MVDFERGIYDENYLVDGFQTLLNNGMADKLQGNYRHTADALIAAGACTRPSHSRM
jgi:hypothetical protein